jgi:mono/diheme cytochrome c family protein
MRISSPARRHLRHLCSSFALVFGFGVGFAGANVFAADDAPVTLSNGFRFEEKDGASLYRAICQSCHMAAGQGASGAGAYPALAANPRIAAGSYVIEKILHGRRGMPAFAGSLSDEQIAEVANYVRTNLGNHYSNAVTTGDVKALR